MTQAIKPLPIHPIPKQDDTLLSWIERTAEANQTPFEVMFKYIEKLSKEIGFFQALFDLTGISLEDLEQMENKIKQKFWNNPK